MKSFFGLTLLSHLGCLTSGGISRNYAKKHWGDYYKEHLTPGAVLVSAEPVKTVELINRRYIVKEYFYDTKTIITQQSYKDARLTILDGPLKSYTDLGVKIVEANYVNGEVVGERLIHNMLTGKIEGRVNYFQGKKEGLLTQYDSVGQITMKAYYHLDSLDGDYTEYNPGGSVKIARVYKNGTIISGPPDEYLPDQVQPKYPCNPKYSDQKNCSEYSLMQYMSKNLRYPRDAREIGIQGKAIAIFVVQKDGTVSDIHVIRGYCKSIRDECIRMLSGMPRWMPGSANGEPVKVRFTLPISFRLE